MALKFRQDRECRAFQRIVQFPKDPLLLGVELVKGGLVKKRCCLRDRDIMALGLMGIVSLAMSVISYHIPSTVRGSSHLE